jgi:hypothetical protein
MRSSDCEVRNGKERIRKPGNQEWGRNAEFGSRIDPECFRELLQSGRMIVPYEGKTLVALLFETGRAPFVVKTRDEFLEVPWRVGTRTNSARRSDLVRLLVPVVKLPDFELLSAGMIIGDVKLGSATSEIHACSYIYVVPKT